MFNERNTVAEVVRRVRAVDIPLDLEVIVVDDGSTDGITIESDRFDFEPEITAKVLRRGHRIYEVPISYAGRDSSEGTKFTWRDGMGALRTLARYRLRPDR